MFMTEAPFRDRRPVFTAADALDRPDFDMVLARSALGYWVGRELPGLSGGFSEPATVRAWLGRLAR
jgi:trehalose 6-phosphate phosphatase